MPLKVTGGLHAPGSNYEERVGSDINIFTESEGQQFGTSPNVKASEVHSADSGLNYLGSSGAGSKSNENRGYGTAGTKG